MRRPSATFRQNRLHRLSRRFDGLQRTARALDSHKYRRKLALAQVVQIVILANARDLIVLAAEPDHYVTRDV